MTTLALMKKNFICPFCKHGYTRESTLLTHSCEKKRRHLAKGEKHVLMGFQAFVRFFQLTQNTKTDKTYEDFIESQFYNTFVKFGSFLSNSQPLYPDKYIDYVIKGGEKIDKWYSDSVYQKYITELIFKESASTAIERSLSFMQEWADSKKEPWNYYFRSVTSARAVHDIKEGKISPWIILNCKSGRAMLENFSDEQLVLVKDFILPALWMKKFKEHPADIEFIKAVVTAGNL